MSTQAKPLDRIDHAIIGLLQNNARLSNKEIAGRVGLAPSSALARVARLIDDGVIAGFGARVPPASVGLPLAAIVFLQFQTHDAKRVATFNAELLARPEVVQLFYIGGAQDLVLHVLARDSEHLRKIIAVDIASHPEVRHVETNIVFEHQTTPVPVTLSNE